MKKILILSFLFLSTILSAQNKKIDSLTNVLDELKADDTQKVDVFNALCFQYRNTELRKAIEFGQKGLQLAKKLEYHKGVAEANNFIGVIYRNLGDYLSSMDYFYQALKVAEEHQLKSQIGYAYNNLGEGYKFQKQYVKAIDYNQKAMKIFEELNDKRGIGYAHLRLAEIYQTQKKYDEALVHSFASLKIREDIKEVQSVGASLANIGMIYIDLGDFDKALEYELKSLKIREEINDEKGRVYTLINLARIYFKLNDYDRSIQYALDSYQSGLKLSARFEVKTATELLYQNYEKKGNYEKAFEYHTLFKAHSDTLVNEEKMKDLGKVEAKSDFDKIEKEMIFEQQQKDLENEKQLVQQQMFAYIALFAFAFLAIVIAVILRNRRKITHTNALLKRANDATHLQNRELSRQQEELTAQRDILEDANKQLTEQGILIDNSFSAAKTIQQAILPYEEKLTRLLNDHFVIYSPKHIVSGDFYWLNQIENKTFLIVADCTGHGVEGAFMTLIGNTLLDKIVRVWDIYDPVKILERLHEEIQIVLRQDETNNRSGMDIAVLLMENMDGDQVKVTFSGAKRGMYYIEKGAKELIEIRGERKSIGGIQNAEKNFKNHEIILNRETLIYLFTDGYPDQNNAHRKKIGENKFKEILQELAEKPILHQKETLEAVLETQVRGTTQRDDILVMGFKL